MNLKKFVGCAVLTLLGAASVFAQNGAGWQYECWYIPADPMEEPPEPYSADYGIQYINNGVFGVSQGVSGTAHWGGPTSAQYPCWQEVDLDAPGRLGFIMGDLGSIQSNFDDGLALSMGAPFDPVGDFCYVLIMKDDNEPGSGVLYGDGGLRMAFQGASKRYFKTAWSDGEVDVILTVRNVGDAAILDWAIQNLGAETRPLGMTFAMWGAQHTSFGRVDSQPNSPPLGPANMFFSYSFNWPTAPLIGSTHKLAPNVFSGFFVTPTTRPIRNPHKFVRNSPRFPAYVQMLAGQTEAYGVHITNIPDATMAKLSPNPLNSNQYFGATPVDLINIGDHGNIMADNAVSFNVFADNTGNAEEADVFMSQHSIVQRWNVTNVGSLATRHIVQVVKSNWGVGNYNDPYTAVVDAPKIVNTDPNGQDGLSPNPMTVRAYIDNQYARLNQEINMSQARVIITLPAGLSLVNGETAEKVIPGIPANALRSVQWDIESDGTTFGELPITVTFIPTPGPQKTISTIIRIGATPRVRIASNAQMVTFPYTFADTSLGAILGLTPEVDFTAYKWDPGQGAYLQASTAIRGESVWIVPTNDEGFIDLNNATAPPDMGEGGMLTTLKKGWNMIGNPYNYAIPLADLVGVVDDSPADSYTWSEMVLNGYVNSAVVTWDRGPNGDNPQGVYKFTTSQSSKLEPHKGYWIYVNTFNPVRIAWPPVYIPGLADAGRGVEENWNKNDRQWRVQLAARMNSGSDTENYVGYVADPQRLGPLTLAKPPQAPNAAVEVVIEGNVAGQPARVAQAMTDKKTRTEFRVHVNNLTAGDVTVTWPNLPSVPRNVRAKLTDLATGEVRDLRAVSGYTYHMNQPGTREFVVTLEQSGSSRPTIGNVLVSQSDRGTGAMTISYALSAEALVSVRVLSTTGKEVYTVTRGRADSSGENQVLWNLRDNANRAVAPGTYRVEILAETPDGERVRKVVPVNVIR